MALFTLFRITQMRTCSSRFVKAFHIHSSISTCLGGQSARKMARRVIIDTDPGIDDAMAIMMALEAHGRGEVKVEAITLVNGNTTLEHSQVNVLRVLETFDLTGKIPVYRGASEGLVIKYNEYDKHHGDDGFNNIQFPSKPDLDLIDQSESAFQAMTRIIKTYPGEVTLVALGPLTNLAMAILSEGSFGSRIQGLFIMGGNSNAMGNTTSCAEFNFHADPEAAYVVLERAKCAMTIVPWETCLDTVMTWDWRLEVGQARTKQAELLQKLEEPWARKMTFGNQWLACDQLAMASFLKPSCIQEQSSHQATIELNGLHTRGQMVLDKRPWRQRSTSNITIVDKIHVEMIKSMIEAMLKSEGPPKAQ